MDGTAGDAGRDPRVDPGGAQRQRTADRRGRPGAPAVLGHRRHVAGVRAGLPGRIRPTSRRPGGRWCCACTPRSGSRARSWARTTRPLPGVPVWSRTLPFWMRNRSVSLPLDAVEDAALEPSGRRQRPLGGVHGGRAPGGARSPSRPAAGASLPAASPDLDAKAGSTHRVTLRLVPGRTLRLTTVDGGERPAARRPGPVFRDASAEQGGPRVASATRSGDGVRAARRGRERLRGPRQRARPGQPGGVRVELEPPRLRPAWAKGVIGAAGLDLGEQALEPGADVAGQVVDENGAGVGGVDVFIDPLGMGRTSRPDARTDPQGFFVIADQARTGELQLSAQGEDVAQRVPHPGPCFHPTDPSPCASTASGRWRDGWWTATPARLCPAPPFAPARSVQRTVGGRMPVLGDRVLGSAESDDDGRFRLGGVTPGRRSSTSPRPPTATARSP